MKLFNKNVMFLFLGVIVVFTMTGCGAKGAKFSGFKTPSNNKSMLYVYRPSSFVGGGMYYNIHATSENSTSDNDVIGTLRNGGFIEKEMPVSENVEIWAKTEAKAAVTLDFEANKTYCIKGSIGIGILVGRPHLSIVDKSICEKEIIETQESSE